MNLPSPRVLWLGCLAVAAVALGSGGVAWATAHTHQISEHQRLARITGHASTIRDVDAALPAWSRLPKSAALAPEIGATIAAAGLPASTLASLNAEPDSSGAVASSQIQVRARRATIVLTSITLPQLGDFLSRWRTRQPGWAVARIDLGAEPSAAAVKAQTGGDLPLHVVLNLQSLSLERPAASAPQRSGGLR